MKDKPKVDIVCIGGMANGFFCAGVFRLIAEMQEEGELPFVIPNIITNSTPTLFAAMFLAGLTDEFAEVCATLRPHHIYHRPSINFLFHPISPSSLFDNQPLKDLIRKHLPKEAVLRVIRSSVSIRIMTVRDKYLGDKKKQIKAWDTHSEYLQKNPEELYKVLFATTGLQVLLPNQKIDGEYYSDCLFANCPIRILPETNPDIAFIVGLNKAVTTHVDVGKEGWLKRQSRFTTALIEHGSGQVLTRSQNTNKDIRAWQKVEEEIREVLPGLPKSMQENLKSILRNGRERFHFAGRKYILTHIVTNPKALNEPQMHSFTNEDLEIVFCSGYKSGIEAFLEYGFISKEAAEEKLRILRLPV